jgi:hypothetical protein
MCGKHTPATDFAAKSARRRYGSLEDFGFAAHRTNFVAGPSASPTPAQCERDLVPIPTLLHMRWIAPGQGTT